MARYLYIGPEEERGTFPTWPFDAAIMFPGDVLAAVERGHLRRLDVEPVAESAPAPEAATEQPAEPAPVRARRVPREPAPRTPPKRRGAK